LNTYENINFVKPVYDENDEDFSRVKKVITEYTKDPLFNTLTQLDSFRN
jgi:hypothetical protein